MGRSQVVDTRATSKSSEWYQNVDMRQRFNRSDQQSLQYINTLIHNCQTKVAQGEDPEASFAQIRQRLHQMEFFDFLSGVLVKKSKVLEDHVGLPQIFDGGRGVEYPWDIKDDAEMLYSKWMQGIIDPHLLRGIETARRQRATGRRGRRTDCKRTIPTASPATWWATTTCPTGNGGRCRSAPCAMAPTARSKPASTANRVGAPFPSFSVAGATTTATTASTSPTWARRASRGKHRRGRSAFWRRTDCRTRCGSCARPPCRRPTRIGPAKDCAMTDCTTSSASRSWMSRRRCIASTCAVDPLNIPFASVGMNAVPPMKRCSSIPRFAIYLALALPDLRKLMS